MLSNVFNANPLLNFPNLKLYHECDLLTFNGNEFATRNYRGHGWGSVCMGRSWSRGWVIYGFFKAFLAVELIWAIGLQVNPGLESNSMGFVLINAFGPTNQPKRHYHGSLNF